MIYATGRSHPVLLQFCPQSSRFAGLGTGGTFFLDT
jgi:hypothetical protein